jgi:predicted PurR-regulated permease PerM
VDRKSAAELLTGNCAQVKIADRQEPQTTTPPQPAIPAEVVEQAAEEVEILHSSVKMGAIAQVVVALVAIIGLLYLLKLVLVTILASILIAYVLEPGVVLLVRWHLPRWFGAMVVIVLAMVMALGVVYFSYNRAVDFSNSLPQYTLALRKNFGDFRYRVDKLANQARAVVEPSKERDKPLPVRIEESHGIVDMISQNSTTIFDTLMAISFVPFLVYFMLASKDHVHVSTVRLFPKEHRLAAHRTVGVISGMIRSFLLANLAVGLVSGAVCAAVFWQLGIQYFYFIGAISGFVTLVPYLGMFLALVPPLAGGAGTLHQGGVVAVIITVLGIHALTVNWIYPRVIGSRLKLNALAVSLSLLFWAWIWGAPGLILAIPILGAVKIVCDHVESLQALGGWLGD